MRLPFAPSAALLFPVLAVLAPPPRAIAQDSSAGSAQAPDEACVPIDDTEVQSRLREIRGAVEHHEPDMRHWWSAWVVLHALMGSVQVVLGVAASDDGTRVDALVGALSSFLGEATLLITLPPLMGAGDRLDDLPETTPEERLAKLQAAETLLRQSADGVDFVRSPLSSLLSTGYLAAASLTVLLGFQRPSGALLLSIGGSVISQGRLLLHPWGIRTEWRRYQRRHPQLACADEGTPLAAARYDETRWTFVPMGVGLGLRVSF